MSHTRDGQRGAHQVVHAERMYAPWWLWIAGGAVGAGAGALFFMGIVEWWRIAIMAAFPLAIWAVLWWVGRLQVRVIDDDTGRHFQADDATVSTSVIAEVEVLEATALRDAMSVALHPLAFMIQRPWMSQAVRLHLNDENDPTPYWIISTRHPHELRDILLGSTSTVATSGASSSAPEGLSETSAH